MAELTWKVDIQGIPHSIHLKHGHLSGKREIWLDGQQIVKARIFIDLGSVHPFSINGAKCEVGITTNGITFGYYLLLDGKPIPEVGKKTNKVSKSTQKVLSQLAYTHQLADVSGLDYIPIPVAQGSLHHRLIGYIRGYLTVILIGFMPTKPGKFVVGMMIRYSPHTDPEEVKRQVEVALLEQEATQEIELFKHLTTEHDYASILLQDLSIKLSPQTLFLSINRLVDALSKYVLPLPADRCEGVNCNSSNGSGLHLVIINEMPRILCDPCIANITEQGKNNQEIYQSAPSRIGQGALVGAGAALAGGVILAVMVDILGRHAAYLAALMIVLVDRVMNETGTKPTRRSMLFAGLMGLTGVMLGVYLSFVIAIIKDFPGHLIFDILQAAWQVMWADKGLLIVSIICGLLGIILYLWWRWSSLKEFLKHVIEPEVEIVRDFSV